MPRLFAKIQKGPEALKVRWRLEVDYLRGNGYRAHYVQDFTRPEDKVLIPAAAQDGSPVFTSEMNASERWRMFETQDWHDEVEENGFFGGTGKLYLWIPATGAEPEQPILTFRIGGKNPQQPLARQYIDQAAGTTHWYAYAVAKHETFGRVREDGQVRFYNQFYNKHQDGQIGDASIDMGSVAWAKGWPLYNLDRNTRNGPQNATGGYGLFQLTWGPKLPNGTQGTGSSAFIPRRMIWNWQENANGAITELNVKLGLAQSLVNGLQATYPSSGAIPNYQNFTGTEAATLTYYNGMGGGQIRFIRLNGFKKQQKTCWTNRSGGWTFLHNRPVTGQTGYVHAVNTHIEEE